MRLRLAVYGFVEEHGGSLTSAHFLVLQELLARGHVIDFYAIEGFVTRQSVPAHPGLRYIPVGHRGMQAAWKWLEQGPSALVRVGRVGLAQLSNHLHMSLIKTMMWRAHTRTPYDAFLVLGLLAPFRIPGLHTVSWSQGSPTGEALWFARNIAGMVRNRAGHLLPALALLYGWKIAEAVYLQGHSDVIIAGSDWSVRMHQLLGTPRPRLVALPYPIDLKRFTVAAPPPRKDDGEFLFLHLGRLVPRKRLDLLLTGFARFRVDYPRARLRIVGRFAYGWGYRRLLADPALMRGVEYREAVPRPEVPGLIAQADCLVQPSEHENFGSAVAEALACGRPVLVGPTNGTRDYIGASSVVFAEYSPAALAEGMVEVVQRLRADPAGVAADSRAAAVRHFDVRSVTDRLEALLRRPCRGNR